jgi:hypothetical protein
MEIWLSVAFCTAFEIPCRNWPSRSMADSRTRRVEQRLGRDEVVSRVAKGVFLGLVRRVVDKNAVDGASWRWIRLLC